jgi:hypothetical protein
MDVNPSSAGFPVRREKQQKPGVQTLRGANVTLQVIDLSELYENFPTLPNSGNLAADQRTKIGKQRNCNGICLSGAPDDLFRLTGCRRLTKDI